MRITFACMLLAAAAAQRPPSGTEAGQLVAATVAQTRTPVTCDGSYRRIPYPGGDVPESIGVCTDVVIRAYRHIGVVIDRQSPDGTPLVVHNIGRGPEIEDVLFRYRITGHYRYFIEAAPRRR